MAVNTHATLWYLCYKPNQINAKLSFSFFDNKRMCIHMEGNGYPR